MSTRQQISRGGYHSPLQLISQALVFLNTPWVILTYAEVHMSTWFLLSSPIPRLAHVLSLAFDVPGGPLNSPGWLLRFSSLRICVFVPDALLIFFKLHYYSTFHFYVIFLFMYFQMQETHCINASGWNVICEEENLPMGIAFKLLH